MKDYKSIMKNGWLIHTSMRLRKKNSGPLKRTRMKLKKGSTRIWNLARQACAASSARESTV